MTKTIKRSDLLRFRRSYFIFFLLMQFFDITILVSMIMQIIVIITDDFLQTQRKYPNSNLF